MYMFFCSRFPLPPPSARLFRPTLIWTNANLFLQTVIEKKKKLTASEERRKKKERMARKKRGEEISEDEL